MKRIQEVIKIEESDRIIFITYDDKGKVNGLNFCQGLDDDKTFFDNYYCNDEKLLKFYQVAKKYVKAKNNIYDDTNEFYDLIDNVCWLYVDLKMKEIII